METQIFIQFHNLLHNTPMCFIIGAQFTTYKVSVSEKFVSARYFRQMASRGDCIILGKLCSFDSFGCRTNSRCKIQFDETNEVCLEEKCVRRRIEDAPGEGKDFP